MPMDNHETLADNHDYDDFGKYSPPAPAFGTTPCWVEGLMTWAAGANSDNTNSLGLIGQLSLFGPYVANNLNMFTCPADIYLSQPQRTAGWTSRCRSIAMNGNIGPGQRWDFGWPSGLTNPITKMGNFTVPGAAMSFVFLDENPDSIDDAQFYVDPAETNGLDAGNAEFTELPGGNHNNACGVSFADGHAEIHKWQDSRTLHTVSYSKYQNPVITGTPDPDLAWLAQRTPYQ